MNTVTQKERFWASQKKINWCEK